MAEEKNQTETNKQLEKKREVYFIYTFYVITLLGIALILWQNWKDFSL
ncbi:hypothetical protein ACOBQJ_09250 [Pelotomaculum propionicicum]